MNTIQKPPVRFLTHDEVISFPRFGHLVDPAFRVRVWQGVSATPMVMASQAKADGKLGLPPSAMTETIANFMNSAVLGYPSCGMLYFESESGPNAMEDELRQVYFEYFGYAYRVRMYRPLHKRQTWEFLDYIVGSPVER